MNRSELLTSHVIGRIQELEPINEVSDNEKPYRALHNPNTNLVIGSIRLYQGTEIIDNVVVVHIRSDAVKMDAYMVMVFTRPGSLYPHLAFDTEVQPTDSAFHIDLLHKKDFSSDIPYIQSVMAPLTDAFTEANINPDFRFSDATLLMKALLNPWMASYHCEPQYLPNSQKTIDAYLDHWLSLAERPANEVQVNSKDDAVVAAFDKAHRAALFDPRVDVLWDFLVNVMGEESRDTILRLVRGER